VPEVLGNHALSLGPRFITALQKGWPNGHPFCVIWRWCDGGGVRVPHIGAQAKWLDDEPQAVEETADSADGE
jgi:hypothetical protein